MISNYNKLIESILIKIILYPKEKLLIIIIMQILIMIILLVIIDKD
jgi:hypothetical protein